MVVYLIRKLQNFAPLSDEERSALQDLAGRRLRVLNSRDDIIEQGQKPGFVNLMLEGFACRYKILPDGRRQILSFFIPGDLCDLHNDVLGVMDHSIGAISPLRIAQIAADEIEVLMTRFPRLRRAFWWNELVGEATTREWLTNLGQRTGSERVAHLLCETFVRMRSIGLVDETGACPFPITQADLSDALGISIVHTNRMLQDLRAEGLIVLKGRSLQVDDLGALMRLANFEPSYLHLRRPGADEVGHGTEADREALA
ncbi:Crp/Fnr family transcriptional regulator [Aureimonas phyllosphaerae]|uniref:CRP-like cAMP-binding protein n=1 Tax=Aureimonas phyllosphaerae TaxID=1166078 RepID=A0A7W6BQH5_9HYPH|nr:Crp/Fnr family transcriptional regulator [Aureimonas phyllosphaerae]MBB3936173.1 CRP-like cAMP-binding protein [Aureimonas phyllosphaerae]MBB3960102.1 CRP-like cAMP-binding protein [Aureimonas phyllosphaerae]SFF33263.1 cAMP-binding domain of CRP or a regulatory subunit of cAMP-dependent protein kinases [Aureimonas phyllosphaerae]